MIMCVFLFALWLLLNGRVTVEICLFGVVIAGAVYAFCVTRSSRMVISSSFLDSRGIS